MKSTTTHSFQPWWKDTLCFGLVRIFNISTGLADNVKYHKSTMTIPNMRVMASGSKHASPKSIARNGRVAIHRCALGPCHLGHPCAHSGPLVRFGLGSTTKGLLRSQNMREELPAAGEAQPLCEALYQDEALLAAGLPSLCFLAAEEHLKAKQQDEVRILFLLGGVGSTLQNNTAKWHQWGP